MKTRLFFSIGMIFLIHGISAQSWIPQGEGLLPDGYTVNSISVVDDSIIWVTTSRIGAWNYPIKVFRSFDAGMTWEEFDVSVCQLCKSKNIEAVNNSVAWLTTYNNTGLGRLFKTEDGGQTWTLKYTDTSAGGTIRIFDETHMMCQNSEYFSWSENGGETWEWGAGVVTGDPMGYTAYLFGSSSVAGDTTWFGTSPDMNTDPSANATVIRATNYGRDFNYVDCGIDSVYSVSLVSFRDHQRGLIAYTEWEYTYDNYYGWSYQPAQQTNLALTNDGGETWTPFPSPTQRVTWLVAIPDAPHSYIVADEEVIWWTGNGGQIWSFQNLPYNIVCMDFSGPNAGWAAINAAAGDQPLVWRWIGDFVSGVEKQLPIKPIALEIFPNPAQDVVYYSFTEDDSSVHQLTLTDATGQVVIDRAMDERELNISDVPAGVYFLEVTTQGMHGVAKVVKCMD